MQPKWSVDSHDRGVSIRPQAGAGEGRQYGVSPWSGCFGRGLAKQPAVIGGMGFSVKHYLPK